MVTPDRWPSHWPWAMRVLVRVRLLIWSPFGLQFGAPEAGKCQVAQDDLIHLGRVEDDIEPDFLDPLFIDAGLGNFEIDADGFIVKWQLLGDLVGVGPVADVEPGKDLQRGLDFDDGLDAQQMLAGKVVDRLVRAG